MLLGTFDPTEYSPKWFHESELVGSDALLGADIQFITPQAAMFELGWLRVEVMPNRLALMTLDPLEHIRLQDAMLGLLRLRDTLDLTAMGLNRHVHLNFENNVPSWHRIGDELAPKQQFWADLLSLPGMLGLSMQGVRSDDYSGHILVNVQNSNVIRPGIFVEHNDHYTLTRATDAPTSRDEIMLAQPDLSETSTAEERYETALEILQLQWDSSMASMDTLLTRIILLGQPYG